ncbi:hypothetical protein D3C87_1595050 [compost metagenome]
MFFFMSLQELRRGFEVRRWIGLAARRQLTLHRDVGDAKLIRQQITNGGQNLTLGIDQGIVDEMYGQAHLATSESPHMQIVDALDPFDRKQSRFHLVNLDLFRDTFKKNIEARFQENPGARKHP